MPEFFQPGGRSAGGWPAEAADGGPISARRKAAWEQQNQGFEREFFRLFSALKMVFLWCFLGVNFFYQH